MRKISSLVAAILFLDSVSGPTLAAYYPPLTADGTTIRIVNDVLSAVNTTKTDIATSASMSTATSSVVSYSGNTLTLSAAADFANGQGIVIDGAGPAAGVLTPGTPTASYTGTAGASTYLYKIVSLDGLGGASAATASGSVSSAAASLSRTAYVTVSWSASGGSFVDYAIYKSSNGGASYSLLGITSQTTWVDGGFVWPVAPHYVPATPPTVAVADWLVTSIVSGGGSTTLTLATGPVTTPLSGAAVSHDDVAALQSDINKAASFTNGGRVVLPCGNMNLHGQTNITTPYVSVVAAGFKCVTIYGFGTNTEIAYAGTSGSQLYGNSLSGVRFWEVDKLAGYPFTVAYASRTAFRDIETDWVWGGPTFYDVNDLLLEHYRGIGQLGYATRALYFYSGATSNDAVAQVVMTDVLTFGEAHNGNGGSGDAIGTDKTALGLNGNVATIQMRAVSLIETEGYALSVTNTVGNASAPEFVNCVDCEFEFNNLASIYMVAGQNHSFTNTQINGSRDNNVYMGPNVINVNFNGGFSAGAAQAGFYMAGWNWSISGMQVYENSSPNSGGTAGANYGVSAASTSHDFTVTGLTTSGGHPTWQSYCMYIAAGADHFNVSGECSTGGSVNAGISNAAGTGSSKIVSVAQ